MYYSFYKLQENPFQITADPRFLWLGAKHEEGLATLKYGVQDNKGFLLLTGDVGTGKTTLVNALLKTLGDDTLVALIRDPDFEPLDFYNYIAYAFKMEREFTRKGIFLIHFEKFLHNSYAANKKVLLIIDEAQRINQELLEEVRLLSNIEREDNKLLNIFFIGQLEFNEILLRPENRAIRQRITINYNLPTLSELETGRYIKHRLEVAGAEEEIHSFATLEENEKDEYVKHGLELPESLEEIFTVEAVKEIFSFSRGYPRLINIICDRCLLTGFVEESKTITAEIVRECKKELELPRSGGIREEAPQFIKMTEKNNNSLPQDTILHANTSGDTEINDSSQPEPVSSINISAEMETKKKSMPSKRFIWPAVFFIILTAGYFGLSKNGNDSLQNHPVMKNTRSIWQAVVNPVDENGQDSEKKITAQPVQPVSNEGNVAVTQEETETSSSVPRDKVQALKKNNMREINKVASAVDTVAPVEPEGSSLLPENKEQPLENKTFNEMNQGADRDIQMIPLVNFEKLIIPFPSNSNFPPVKSLEELNILVGDLLTRPSYRIIVRGFTDSQGSGAYNKKLSEFRANSIKSYLVGRGVPESRITAQGLGKQDPIAPNDTDAGRSANRRVEIEIIQ